MTTTQTQDDDRFDDEDDFGDQKPACMNCGGDGFVDSVAAESGRWGWDDDGPGTCWNCNGSGLRKDQQCF
jgi:DnaJ-class molecular chaperone